MNLCCEIWTFYCIVTNKYVSANIFLNSNVIDTCTCYTHAYALANLGNCNHDSDIFFGITEIYGKEIGEWFQVKAIEKKCLKTPRICYAKVFYDFLLLSFYFLFTFIIFCFIWFLFYFSIFFLYLASCYSHALCLSFRSDIFIYLFNICFIFESFPLDLVLHVFVQCQLIFNTIFAIVWFVLSHTMGKEGRTVREKYIVCLLITFCYFIQSSL